MTQVIAVGPKVNVADLGNGFYTQLSAPVAFDDAYREKLQWLAQECRNLPTDIRFIAQSQSGDITVDVDGTPVLPTIIAFGSGANETRMDASQVGVFPHIARIELINRYGGGDPSRIVMYVPPSPAQSDGTPSPIGSLWLEKGPNAYRPSDDNPTAKGYEVGDTYTDVTGTYQLEKRRYWIVLFPVWIKVS